MQALTTFGESSKEKTISPEQSASGETITEESASSESVEEESVSSESYESPEEEEKEDFSLFSKEVSYASVREEVRGSSEAEIVQRIKQLGTITVGHDYIEHLRLLFYKVFRSKTSITLAPVEVFTLYLGIQNAFFFKAERSASENLYHFLVYLSACVNNTGILSFYTLILDIPQEVYMLETQLLNQPAREAVEVIKVQRSVEKSGVDALEINVAKRVLTDEYSMHTGVPFYNVFRVMQENPLKCTLPPRQEDHSPPQALDNQIIMLPLYPRLKTPDEEVEVVEYVYE